MFQAHRPIFRRVCTAVHTTIGSVSVPLCSCALCVVLSNANVFGFYLFQPTCFIEPNGCVSSVQLSSDVLIFVDYVCLFGIDKF